MDLKNKSELSIMHLILVLVFLHGPNRVYCREDDQYCPRGRCKDNRCPRTRDERCLEDNCYGRRKRCGDTLLCIKINYRSCPGENCTRMEGSCADGSCVLYKDKCSDGSDPCFRLQRRCQSGICVYKINRCEEDPCPERKPYKCGGKCYYIGDVCDGYHDCSDGSDELGCDEGNKPNLLWLLVLLIIPLSCCGCWFHYCYKGYTEDDDKDVTGMNEEQTGLNPISSGPIQPHIAVSTVIHNSSSGTHVMYQPTNPGYQENPVNAPLLAPSAPQLIPSNSEPSAPPGYVEVMSNQHMYPPPSPDAYTNQRKC